MAKLAVTVAVIFLLFTLSHARTPLPETVVDHRDLPESSPESVSNPTLQLPSEKRKSEPAFVADHGESGSEIADSKSIGIETQSSNSGVDLPGSVTGTVESIPLTRPLTIVRFRPVNRHFRSFPFRFSHRDCLHLHRQLDQLNRPLRGGELSYGNDMLLSTESKGFDLETTNGGVRQIPARMIRFDHRRQPNQFNRPLHGIEISYGNDMIESSQLNGVDRETINGGVREIPAKWIRFHHHHHHHKGMPRFMDKNDDVVMKQKEVEEREGGGGFMNRIRKFLNHF